MLASSSSVLYEWSDVEQTSNLIRILSPTFPKEHIWNETRQRKDETKRNDLRIMYFTIKNLKDFESIASHFVKDKEYQGFYLKEIPH